MPFIHGFGLIWSQEMGFSWEQSSEALKTHATLEGAIESLFSEGGGEASHAARTGPLSQFSPVLSCQTAAQETQSRQPCRRTMATARKKNGLCVDPADSDSGRQTPPI